MARCTWTTLHSTWCSQLKSIPFDSKKTVYTSFDTYKKISKIFKNEWWANESESKQNKNEKDLLRQVSSFELYKPVTLCIYNKKHIKIYVLFSTMETMINSNQTILI